MKKNLCLYCVLLTVVCHLSSESLTFRVTKDTPLYRDEAGSAFSENDIVGILEKNEIFHMSEVSDFSTDYKTINGNDEHIVVMKISHNNTSYYIDVADIIPATSADVFDPSFVFEFSGENGYWISEYYLNVLQSQNRQALFNYEPYYADFKNNYEGWSGYNGWWEVAVQAYANFKYFNTCVLIGGSATYPAYFVKNIMKTSTGYNITVITNFLDKHTPIESMRKRFPWYAPYADLEEFTMLVRIDGDYMNVYVNDETQKMCTLVRVNQEFIHQWESLLMTDSCDLSAITFPRYADGTSDYDIREERYQKEGGVYRIQESLRVRNGEGTHSSVLTTLDQNTEVTILRIGSEALIDKIKSNWVHVQLADGTTGWCFGGYLREETVAELHEKMEELRRVQEAQQEAESKKKAAQDALEQQALAQQRRTVFFSVIGSIVLLAIVISAVVILTQKKQKK